MYNNNKQQHIDKEGEKKREGGRGKEDTPYASTSDKLAQAKRGRNKGDNENQDETEDNPHKRRRPTNPHQMKKE